MAYISRTFENNSEVNPRVSSAKKSANNSKRQKQIIDQYCANSFSDGFDEDRLRNFDLNYDLLNGRVDTKIYDDNKTHSIMGETFTLNDNPVIHYPLISQIGQAMIGEQLRRPFSLVVQDLSPYKETFVAKEYNKLLKSSVEKEFLGPLKKQIASTMLKQFGIEDPLSLTPEEQQEFKSQIEGRAKALSPKEIAEYMENDYRTPVAKQAQEVMAFLGETLNLREKNIEGFIHSLPTGEEYYYVDAHRDDLVFENVYPDELIYGGSPNKTWVQTMDWARRDQVMTIPDITEKYAEYLTPKMLKDLEGGVMPMSEFRGKGFSKEAWYNQENIKTVLEASARDGEFYLEKYGNLDTRTIEGNRNFNSMYGDVMGVSGTRNNLNVNNLGLRVQHVTWKDNRLYKKVLRYNSSEDRMESYWVGENYEPVESDYSVTKVWAKEVWQGTKIADHYLKVEPVKYQHGTIKNPYNLELPYYGKRYFSYANRTKNRSVVDSGKTYQRDFDIQMAELKHTIKTNMGNLFPYNIDAKPEKMKQKEFFTLLKDFSMLPIQNRKHGVSPIDNNILKSINASKMAEIGENINLLNFFREGLFDAMYFSKARAGAAGQYTNTSNLQSQQSASSNQTEPINETHRIIFEKAARALMDKARMHYKEHHDQIEHILSPSSLMELKAGREFFYTEMGIELENSGFEMQQIEFLKQQMMQLVGGAGGNGIEIILELTQATTKSDIINLTKRYKKEIAEAQQQAQQFEMQKLEKQQQQQQAITAATQEYDYKKHVEVLRSQEARAQIQSLTIKNAADTNGDGKAELVLAKEKQIEADRIAKDKQLEFDREELALKYGNNK